MRTLILRIPQPKSIGTETKYRFVFCHLKATVLTKQHKGNTQRFNMVKFRKQNICASFEASVACTHTADVFLSCTELQLDTIISTVLSMLL